MNALPEPFYGRLAAILRPSAFQAGCRGFESRLPLHSIDRLCAGRSQAAWEQPGSDIASKETVFLCAKTCTATSCLRKAHCLTGNLPLSASSISFPPILYWSLLQDRNFAHQLWSSRRTRHTLERKRKIFHEANRGEVSVASAHRSPAARFQRRGAWKSR